MDTSQLKGRGLTPLLSLRNHARLSMLIWVIVLIVGAPVVWIKGQSSYIAEAVFQVSPSYMKNLAADKELEFQSNSQYREFVNHLSQTVIRYDVIQRALAKINEAGVKVQPASMTERKFIERLQRTVYVRAIPDTYMVRIGLEGAKRETLHVVVNAVMESFLETTKNEQIFGAGDRLDVLNNKNETLKKEIGDLEVRRLKYATALRLTTFSESTINPYDTMLAQAREKFTIATIDRAQADAVLQAFLAQRETPMVAGRSLLEMRLQDNGLQSLRNEVIKRSEELDRTTTGLEDLHPAKKPAQAEYEVINQRLKNKEIEFEKGAFESVRSRLTASLRQTRQVESEVTATLTRLEGLAADYAKNFQEAMRITHDIQKRELELKDVRDRLNYLQTERGAIGFVRLVTSALPAETPQGIGKTKMALIVIALATALALVAPIAVDFLDRRIQTVSEAEKLMEMPAAGWQVEITDFATKLFAKEQSRRFASTLIRDKAKNGKSVFAFASVRSVGGASTAMYEVAVDLQQLGKRVLIVDANFVPGYLGKGKAQTIGLTDYLGLSASLDDIVQSIDLDGASVSNVSIGTLADGGLRRLDLLAQATAKWELEYDFVFFDLPPVLQSADTELLIGLLGQVFLVVEAQSVTRGDLGRAKWLLEKVDPQAIGIFVNRIHTIKGAGYMQELIVETLTRDKFAKFMSLSMLKLQFELMRTQWQQRRYKKTDKKS